MTFKEEISTLYKMRFLDEDDIEVFEDILNKLCYQGTNDIIPDLCTIFEDDIAQPSAGGDLIDTIFYIAEHNDLEDGLYKLATGIPKMLPHAEFWAERIHRTLLNSEGLVIPYIKSLKNIDSSTKQIIKEILHFIKEDDPDLYLEKVDFIFKEVI
ncbi:Imm30 family immunity protein [Metabacillus fastidiosus]|uniref:Imm30 family immunity protein n=1 Tax=Metabacillus fastidiosus TaxID=1458 RepID=UPI002DBC6525|nr:Imm30 family immunity protein [Metabacillus fastidiosus]MEC2074526.1 Imm30 family immunity protein [Metabacillus fastidiosus]